MRQNRLMAFLRHNEQLMEKIRESLASVLPITAIVLAISVTVAPLTALTSGFLLAGRKEKAEAGITPPPRPAGAEMRSESGR